MRNFCIIGLFAIALYSCSEPAVEKRVYTEKDIEGYWATSTLINGTPLMKSIDANSGKSIESGVLRLFNDPGVKKDYRLGHDTLYLYEFEIEYYQYVWKPKYIIEFATDDRLMLREIGSGQELTYHSLLNLPATSDVCDSIKEEPLSTGFYFTYSTDSSYWDYSELDDGLIVCGTFEGTTRKPDPAIVSRVNALYCRLNRKDILTMEYKSPLKINDSTFEYSYSQPLRLYGSRGMEIIGNTENSTNPVVRALNLEFNSIAFHGREYIK